MGKSWGETDGTPCGQDGGGLPLYISMYVGVGGATPKPVYGLHTSPLTSSWPGRTRRACGQAQRMARGRPRHAPRKGVAVPGATVGTDIFRYFFFFLHYDWPGPSDNGPGRLALSLTRPWD